MQTAETSNNYNGQQILAMLAGWQPLTFPQHRALEAEAAEQIDLAERATFSRRAAR